MARKHGGICSSDEIWHRFVEGYQQVFCEALNRLTMDDTRGEREDAISEALNPVLKKVCFEQKCSMPQWERPISPGSKKELKGGNVHKRPDFTCTVCDEYAATHETYERSLHVECKRLGAPSASWDLNRNYCENGINRFDSPTHEYGKQTPSGMMIGYVVHPDKKLILSEVNKHLPSGMSPLSFPFREKVETCDSRMMRNNVEPQNFKLIHIWADLCLHQL